MYYGLFFMISVGYVVVVMMAWRSIVRSLKRLRLAGDICFLGALAWGRLSGGELVSKFCFSLPYM